MNYISCYVVISVMITVLERKYIYIKFIGFCLRFSFKGMLYMIKKYAYLKKVDKKWVKGVE